MIQLITYDLHEPERDYKDVIAKIKSFGSCAHVEESVWLVDTTRDCSDNRDDLAGVSEEATYFVIQLKKHWAARGLPKDVVTWLKDPTRRWT